MWFKINFWSCFIFTFLALKSFTCGLRITFGFVLYSHFWHWKFYISTEINFWFCFIITFLTLKCYTFMFGLYMCFETTCEMILMLCVDILLWRNIYTDRISDLYMPYWVQLNKLLAIEIDKHGHENLSNLWRNLLYRLDIPSLFLYIVSDRTITLE